MTTREVTSEPLGTALISKVKASPAGTITRVPGGVDTSIYGSVEIAWYPDHLTITALGAGPSSVTRSHLGGDDLVVEIRPPDMDEPPEGLPGAD